MRQTRPANGTTSATRPATASFGAAVRDTRAGDRFHYVWAASRSLHLLDKRSRLQEIWIEGLDGPPAAGDEVIDVAELRGESPSTIDEISVLQLK